jgi:hypothetical protein
LAADFDDDDIESVADITKAFLVCLTSEAVTWLRCLEWLAAYPRPAVGCRRDVDLSKRLIGGTGFEFCSFCVSDAAIAAVKVGAGSGVAC